MVSIKKPLFKQPVIRVNSGFNSSNEVLVIFMAEEIIPNDKKTYMRSLDMPILENFDDIVNQLRLSRKLVYWLIS